jgi:phytoene desaturase
MGKLVYKPGLSLTEFLDRDVLSGLFRLHLLRSVKSHIRKYFKNEKIRRLMEFPVLFLGALPANTPALYSLMNYADIIGGTWYPDGGIFAVVQGMYKLATELGVEFHFQEEVTAIEIENARAYKLVTGKTTYRPDVVISNADYHFTETTLLPERYRSYTGDYWNKKLMAPSCLLYFIGLGKKLENVQHHSLFFDVPFEQHAAEIYNHPQWPTNPLFYVSINSVTDKAAAPPGCDNLVVLIPVAAGLAGDDDTLREKFLDNVLRRMENSTGQKISEHIVYKKTWSVSDFVSEYHSFRGNAYGLANTLTQTAVFRPSCKSRRVKNLFYTGQLTVPGPGVPPAIISGEVVAGEVLKSFR